MANSNKNVTLLAEFDNSNGASNTPNTIRYGTRLYSSGSAQGNSSSRKKYQKKPYSTRNKRKEIEIADLNIEQTQWNSMNSSKEESHNNIMQKVENLALVNVANSNQISNLNAAQTTQNSDMNGYKVMSDNNIPSGNHINNRKRPSEDDSTTYDRDDSYELEGASPTKKRKLGQPHSKNPISALNEAYPGLHYQFENREGPSHSPTFVVSVELGGQKFVANGKSKKIAKQNIARDILSSQKVQFKNTPAVEEVLGIRKERQDFTSDEMDVSFTADSADSTQDSSQEPKQPKNIKKRQRSGDELKPPKPAPMQTAKNPIMLLNELRQNVLYTLIDEVGDPHAKTFTFEVHVDLDKFVGTGSSKKYAKAAAARQALSKLYGMITSSATIMHHIPVDSAKNLHLDQELADKISTMVNEMFAIVTEGNQNISRRKVLAGIIRTNKEDENDLKVICVTTGTKCVSGARLSLCGMAVNDCHAEILARRCLLNYLYNHLEHIAGIRTLNEECILEGRPAGVGYRLKDKYEFHLYINTAPCGDSRIFSPHEEEALRDDKHPNRQSRGLLRTKIESGEGTIPLQNTDDRRQTWDGLMQGERLRTMSCSDKLARWNIVGVQGALLGHFIDPIYLQSIVLGSLFHASHMYRAICGRIEYVLKELPQPYFHNKPKMNQGTSMVARQPQKAPTIALNWDCCAPRVEVLNSLTGMMDGDLNDSIKNNEKNESKENAKNKEAKKENTSSNEYMRELERTESRLCKKRFLKKFLAISQKLSTITELNIEKINNPTYEIIKKCNTKYMESGNAVEAAFHGAGLGYWIHKPLEQDAFWYDFEKV